MLRRVSRRNTFSSRSESRLWSRHESRPESRPKFLPEVRPALRTLLRVPELPARGGEAAGGAAALLVHVLPVVLTQPAEVGAGRGLDRAVVARGGGSPWRNVAGAAVARGRAAVAWGRAAVHGSGWRGGRRARVQGGAHQLKSSGFGPSASRSSRCKW